MLIQFLEQRSSAMDRKTKSELVEIIDTLKDDLEFAKSELHRLNYDYDVTAQGDAATEPAADDAQGLLYGPHDQYGAVVMPIHFTLGRGVRHALGEDVEGAVFRAFRRVAGETNLYGVGQAEIDIGPTGISVNIHWDKENSLVCLHLEQIHTNAQISAEDWAAAEAELPPPFE
jgi:hypothetical protein